MLSNNFRDNAINETEKFYPKKMRNIHILKKGRLRERYDLPRDSKANIIVGQGA